VDERDRPRSYLLPRPISPNFSSKSPALLLLALANLDFPRGPALRLVAHDGCDDRQVFRQVSGAVYGVRELIGSLDQQGVPTTCVSRS